TDPSSSARQNVDERVVRRRISDYTTLTARRCWSNLDSIMLSRPKPTRAMLLAIEPKYMDAIASKIL
ncbi:MAG: hypothetical protein MUO26_05650, partial [Methanotrichaceae archaeon]|nr:hypothetical protein [Methanotrichaceae archaeon]